MASRVLRHAPSAPALEDWLTRCLTALFDPRHKIRYEASMYGPLNVYLQTFFPVRWNFMVKPQGYLLPERDDGIPEEALLDAMIEEEQLAMEEDAPGFEELEVEGEADEEDEEDAEYLGNTSMDSYGRVPSYARQGKRAPDFIVTKATGSLYLDKIVLVVEVKKGRTSNLQAELQLGNYLRHASSKSHVPTLRGILIKHRVFDMYEVRHGGQLTVVQTLLEYNRYSYTSVTYQYTEYSTEPFIDSYRL
ncbi:hypothetical protein BU15DRAFT_79766 [Melanogaster broomeanus]|nr:hypothetical protein BU15DRAFT_79766 [Melanogaster broomeanus]